MLRPLALTLLLAGCSLQPPAPPAAAPADTRALRTFDVPPGLAHETVALLEDVVAADGSGRVRVGPDGRVVVVADASMMPGVESLIAQLAEAGAASPPRVRIQYWLVLGQPADQVTVAPELASLRPVLDEVAAAQAPMDFTLVEALSVRGESGEYVELAGLRAEVFQTASVRGDVVVADVNIQPAGGAKVQTRVQLRPDQTLVLGETGVDPSVWGGPSGRGAGAPPMLYYVLRPTVEGARGER